MGMRTAAAAAAAAARPRRARPRAASRPDSVNRHPAERPLPMSLAYPFDGSDVPDGYTHDPAADSCDAEVQDCNQPVDQWVQQCYACNGSGVVKTSRGSRRRGSQSATCLQCHGLGHVRVATQRLQPNGNALYGQNRITPLGTRIDVDNGAV